VGGAAHSFGLETLVEEGVLDPSNLAEFLRGYLAESGRLDAVFVRRAWRGENCAALAGELSARRPARESRDASWKMARRFAGLFEALTGRRLPERIHYPIAFGAAGAVLDIPEDFMVPAYLQQSVTGLVSACQRLMPLGQVAASRLIWNLKTAIVDAASNSERLECTCFSPLAELGSMRHASIETRLFIS
jgi:urease accessory protein